MRSRLLKRLESCENSVGAQEAQHIKFNDDGSVIIYKQAGDLIYNPVSTARELHTSNDLVRLMTGPYGSGKSTACIFEIVRRACQMPVWSNGRRRSRWIVIRNTTGELVTTTIKTWMTWFDELGDLHKRDKPVISYEHTFNDGHGVVELEILFRALDKPADLPKVKSLEATGCYINELSELPADLISHMCGRVNHRYPPIEMCKDYWCGVIADTNMPDDDHWLYDMFETKQLESYRRFKQPPGLIKEESGWVENPNCDNRKHLAVDYYTRISAGQSEDFIKVFCLGEWGTVSTGKRVYPEFNSDLHATEGLEAVQGHPLYLGWDFGLTPACLVVQLTTRGQLLVLKEYIGIDIGIRSFAESIVLPGLMQDFPYCKVGKSVGDPAGNARDTIVEEMSCIGELCSLGLETYGARTNDLDPRLGGVKYFLTKLTDGKAGFLIDRTKCPVTFKGLAKDYVYKRIAVAGEARFRDTPDKNMTSHPLDALGYVCLEIASDYIVQDKRSKRSSTDMYNPVMRIWS